MTVQRLRSLIVPVAVLVASAGCASAGVGGTGGALSAPSEEGATATVSGEILDNDPAAQQLRIRTDDGREGIVRWDTETRVIYKTETYEARALERGDRVQMRIEQTSDGEIYTEYVLVTESAQERIGPVGLAIQ